MKTLRTIILIAGILVAALAYNTSVAQERVHGQKEVKFHKHDRKEVKIERSEAKVTHRPTKTESKLKLSSDLKARKHKDRKEQKVKIKRRDNLTS